MNQAGDAAEQIVRLTLDGVEVAAKLTGAGAKELAVMLYTILKDQKKTRGKTRLTSMLRSEKPLKIFAVKDEQLKLFCREAKKYGVLYCVLKDRDATDGLTDIMVRAEDAAKINRIFERFQLATVDMAELRSEVEQERQEQQTREHGGPSEPAPQTEEQTDQLLDQLLGSDPGEQEQPVQADGELPAPAGTDEQTADYLDQLLGPDPFAPEQPTQGEGPTHSQNPQLDGIMQEFQEELQEEARQTGQTDFSSLTFGWRTDPDGQEQQGGEPAQPPTPERAEPQAQSVWDQILAPSSNEQEQQTGNPTDGRTESPSRSEPTSETREEPIRGASDQRPSVREEIRQIRKEQEKKAELPQPEQTKSKGPTQGPQHQAPGKARGKKNRHKPIKQKER